MSRRPVPTADRPSLERRRRSPLRFLREEWGLLGLAAVLTLMTWYITRLDVEKTFRLPASRLDVNTGDDNLKALVADPGTVDIALVCSQSEYEDALERMAAQDHQIEVQFDSSEVATWQRMNALNSTFRYPFRTTYLQPGQDLLRNLRGWVYRVRGRTTQILEPPVRGRPRPGEVAEIIMPQDTQVTLDAPDGVVGSTLQPDAIDLDKLQNERGQRDEIPRTLQFDQWARTGEEAVQLFRRKAILPALNIGVTVRFVKIAKRKINHTAIYVVPNADRYTFKVKERADVGLNVQPPDKVNLELEAPESLLRQLEDDEGRKHWVWGIVINGELPAEGDSADLTGKIEFLPLDERFRDRRIRFEAPQDSKGFEITVTYPKKE